MHPFRRLWPYSYGENGEKCKQRRELPEDDARDPILYHGLDEGSMGIDVAKSANISRAAADVGYRGKARIDASGRRAITNRLRCLLRSRDQ